MSTIITNARLVLEGEVVRGSVELGDRQIRSVDQGASGVSQAIDAEGDFLAPGLIEIHTDNLERHFMPRPGVVWPNALAAALAHDGQMAAAGVTTVYDAICVGYERDNTLSRADIFNGLVAAIGEGVRQDALRIEHRLHLRCELTGGELVRTVAPHLENPLVCLASLMDHTPGQRQWRELASHKRYTMGTTGMSEAEFDAHVAKRIAEGGANAERNRPIMVDMFRSRGIPLATHDDTTEEHVRSAAALGIVISEFPTTLVAATTAKALGLATIAGAPNVVCGGSHSGGVSVGELAERGVLDGLSSDYVPASLLQAVQKLSRQHCIAFLTAMGMVTWRIADMLGLGDRGRLSPGLRADIVQFRLLADTPVVRGLWCAGRRVL
jgi:alpha-D-ribose 1-methylphosphonate 5-triphosphate diphosphatase